MRTVGCHILVTGGTGCLGSELTERLLRERAASVAVIVRDTRNGRRGAARLRSEADFAGRVECLVGDITEPDFGLRSGEVERLRGTVDEVWHLAALTRFEEVLWPQLERVNVVGTENVLAFASRLPRLRRLHHISTAYVAGRAPAGAVVHECLHRTPSSFRNPYEASKHTAERRVASSGLPHAIYRPTIVLGDSDFGGETSQSVYGVAKMARLAKLLGNRAGEEVETEHFRVVGNPHAVKNVVPSHVVVDTLMRLRAADPPSGAVFHIANPKPPAMGDLVQSVAGLLGLQGCTLVPRLESGDLSVAERTFQRMARPYESYMLDSDPVFDMQNTLATIGTVHVPDVGVRYLKDRIRRFYVASYGPAFADVPSAVGCPAANAWSAP